MTNRMTQFEENAWVPVGKYSCRFSCRMSFGANTGQRQLYTKRNFIQVGDGDRIVRLKDSGDNRNNRQQRLIRLIPLVEGSWRRDDTLGNLQAHTIGGAGRKLDDCPNSNGIFSPTCTEQQRHENSSDFTRDCRTNIERLMHEKTRLEHEFVAHKQASNQASETGPHANIEDRSHFAGNILSAIKEDLRVLLCGQQNIDSRLDSLQKEQLKTKHELEGDLARIKEELKAAFTDKPIEQTTDLAEVREKQQNLYNEFNLLFLRLDEMEQLVANLLRDTKENPFMKVEEQKPGKIEEITKSESLQSVLSISSGSSVEDPSSQLKKYRKPSQAFLFSQSIEEPKDVAVGKGQAMEITRF